MQNNSVVLENDIFRLVISENGRAESLVLKSSQTERLYHSEMPFFSLTEDRPFHNEIKLAHPTKKTTFCANRIRKQGDNLIVGFEMIDFEAVIKVEISNRYMVFSLVDFLVKPDSFGLGVEPILPPVREFRLVQLPILKRARFGEWLNVVWDDEVAINVLSACPYSKVGAEKRKDHQILFGETLSDVKLKNAEVALIVSKPEELLDGIEALEIEKGLPLGVKSRRNAKYINRSYYWIESIDPDTVDMHIHYALKGGFKYILIHYSAIRSVPGGFLKTGVYNEYSPIYKNGREDLIAILDKIKAAGIIPGLHILHSHIGLQSRYLTPVADHRLNLKKHFTLSKPLSVDDTTIYVEENPAESPVFEKMRVLQFMGELIWYESYTTERPYCFKGCKRGFNNTTVKSHEIGTIGGVLDISEFCCDSAYINQNNSLQDEIAMEIAALYNAGFEFVYFDGSEGVNPPFDINVGLAQWRVYKMLEKEPIFCEGAAKSNFSWHMLSGGNAFDVWKPDVFKKMIAEHPFKEAAKMTDDFTRVNFGWWDCSEGMRPDVIEYGTALAAAWDCPGSFISNLKKFQDNPRIDDLLETIRRWEDARDCGFITAQIKDELKQTDVEHTLLIDENGNYKLSCWEQVKDAASGNNAVTVFLLEYKGKTVAVCWNNVGSGYLSLTLAKEKVSYVDNLGGKEIELKNNGAELVIPIDKKRYLISEVSKEELATAFKKAKLL